MNAHSGEKLVAGAAALAAGASLLVSGCSGETPQSLDATPTVAEYVAEHSPELDLLFNPEDITSNLQHATLPAGRTSWYDPPFKKPLNVPDAASTPSAKLLEIHADTNGALHYTASDQLTGPQLNQLLHDVDQQGERLSTVMRPDAAGKIALDSITFRIFDTHGPAQEHVHGGMVYGADVDMPDKSSIYYFLSGDQTVNNVEISEMLGHEAEHAALGHRKNTLTVSPAQQTRLSNACKVLAKSATEELMTERGFEQTDGLETLRDAVDAPYKLAFDRVKTALEDGAYIDLPKNSENTVPACVLEPPTFAVNKQVAMQGLNATPMIDTIMGRSGGLAATATTMSNIVEGFYTSMRGSQAFHNQAESTYLPSVGTAAYVGHPSDDVFENMASTGNVATLHPGEFIRNMQNGPAEVQAAVGEVLAVDAEVLAHRYPGSQLAVQTENVAKQLAPHK